MKTELLIAIALVGAYFLFKNNGGNLSFDALKAFNKAEVISMYGAEVALFMPAGWYWLTQDYKVYDKDRKYLGMFNPDAATKYL